MILLTVAPALLEGGVALLLFGIGSDQFLVSLHLIGLFCLQQWYFAGWRLCLTREALEQGLGEQSLQGRRAMCYVRAQQIYFCLWLSRRRSTQVGCLGLQAQPGCVRCRSETLLQCCRAGHVAEQMLLLWCMHWCSHAAKDARLWGATQPRWQMDASQQQLP